MKITAAVLLFFCRFGLCSCSFRKHFYINISKSWNNAQTYCRDSYDDLSTVSGPDLQKLSNNPEVIYYYYSFGLYADKTVKMWKWSAGGKATINNWANGEPKPDRDKCGFVDKYTSEVNDNDCTWTIPFYCMEDYELILVKQENTWEEALNYCRQHYIDLAILSSDVIMAEAKINSTEAQTDVMWTGLRFLSGQWFWVNGEDLQYKAWSVGEELQCPAMNQRCGVYHRHDMVWKPEDCEKKLNFLCVKKLNV